MKNIIEDKSKPLNIRSSKELLILIDKAFDKFSFQGDGKWQDITEENMKQMKLTKKTVQKYYEYRRLALWIKEFVKVS